MGLQDRDPLLPEAVKYERGESFDRIVVQGGRLVEIHEPTRFCVQVIGVLHRGLAV